LDTSKEKGKEIHKVYVLANFPFHEVSALCKL
jgi:hypothetical protein